MGLAKKVLLANTLASAADTAFGMTGSLNFGGAWAGLIAYALQIYFDFSGYSDMAIGLGKMLGFSFPENFRYPYVSLSVKEFWRRWHLSLSTWFRDYLYIPLGGSRRGKGRTLLNPVSYTHLDVYKRQAAGRCRYGFWIETCVFPPVMQCYPLTKDTT